MADHHPAHGDSSSGEFDQSKPHAVEHDLRNHSVAGPGRANSMSAAERTRANVNAKLANPLAGLSHPELRVKGADYVRKHHIGDEEDIRAFELGAILAQDPARFETTEGLTGPELDVLRKEFTNRWSQPRLMYLVIILCSTCAAVQGMGKSTFLH